MVNNNQSTWLTSKLIKSARIIRVGLKKEYRKNKYGQLKKTPIIEQIIHFIQTHWNNLYFRYLAIPAVTMGLISGGVKLLNSIIILITLRPNLAMDTFLGIPSAILIGIFIGCWLGGIPLSAHWQIKAGRDNLHHLLQRVVLLTLASLIIPPLFPFAPYISIYWKNLFALGKNNNSQNKDLKPKIENKDRQILRGTFVVSAEELQRHFQQMQKWFFRENSHQTPQLPLLQVAGIKLPNYLENLGFFTVGSPGSGKTQAISQMLERMRERSDYRVIVFDRNAEFLERFYDPNQDYIFNPSDSRTIVWSHQSEPISAENMATALIPEDPKDPFFATAGRALMADLYERCDNNAEILEVLNNLSIEELKVFLQGGLSARYFESEKTGASVLSTVVNQARFYRHLPDGEHYFSFAQWASGNASQWLFLPLFENNADLLKPLYSLLFDLVIQGLLSKEERSIKTAIVIDELGALQKLDKLPRLVSEGRKFKSSIVLGTQTQAQINKVYGEEDTKILLQGSATKLILNCRDDETAERFAKIIGLQERLDKTYSKAVRKPKRDSTVNESIRETYAVLPSELQALPELTGYLTVSDGTPPAKVTIQPKAYPAKATRFQKRELETNEENRLND